MKIINAKTAGFCFGVRRAVSICEKAASECSNCVTFGPIIHNDSVIKDLDAKGVGIITDAAEATPGHTVIIRSHGACRSEREALESRCGNIIDATCPDVGRIHKIAREESSGGRRVMIIGERSHPEVSAIASWCQEYAIFETADELLEWLGTDGNAGLPLSFVFQTTHTRAIFDTIVEIIKKECTNFKIFDTICNATRERQLEAEKLSQTVDAMIVIGDKNSANSLKLADICTRYCRRVFFVETANDLCLADFRDVDTVGITAGASTPAWIIKEVNHKMSGEELLDETTTDAQALDGFVEPAVADGIVAAEAEAVDAVAVPEPDAVATDAPLAAYAEEIVAVEDDAAQEAGVAPDLDAAVEAADEPPVAEAAVAEGDGADAEAAPVAEPAVAALVDEPAEEEAPAAEAPAAEATSVADETAEAPAAEETTEAAPVAAAEPPLEAITVGEAAADEPAAEAASQTDAPIETPPADATDEPPSEPRDESFEEMLERSIKTLHTGQKVAGIVTSITATEVSVDLGTKQSGYIPISEFTDDANANIDDIIKVGDSIESFVLRVNDVEGMVTLSKKRLDAIKNWDDIEAAKDSRAIVEGHVTEENKGGIVVNVKGVRVFVPASQTGLPKSAPMTDLVKKTVKLRITEVNQSRRRVVGSIRAVQAEERREKSDRLWEEIEKGKQYDGVVKSMTSYGVFVDIGGIDGMIHISELSWTRIKQPSEVMSVGDEVSVYVLSFDRETRKISLGYKKSEDNPWARFTSQYSVGNIVNVKIVKMMPFGAFAEICPGVDGLIHISQITDHRIGLPSEILSDGQLVDVKITEIDNDRKKVSLSIRALIDPSSQRLSDRDVEEAAAVDKTPVVVYDTDAPPAFDDDDDSPSDGGPDADDSAVDVVDEAVAADDDAADADDDVDAAVAEDAATADEEATDAAEDAAAAATADDEAADAVEDTTAEAPVADEAEEADTADDDAAAEDAAAAPIADEAEDTQTDIVPDEGD